MSWIIENKEWLFSGVGVIIIGAIISYFWKKKTKSKRSHVDNSINQTIGKNIKSKDGNVEFKENKQEINTNKPE